MTVRSSLVAPALAALLAPAAGCAAAPAPTTRPQAPLPSSAASPAVALEGPARDPATCNRPVILVVWIEHLDRSRSKAYGEGLRSTRIVPRHGGQYVAVSPPLQVLEGEWPADRGFVTERYPCRAAFEAMWFSEEYQKRLKPLRDGSGRYTIALFDERPAR